MSLPPGLRLGPYEILAPLGAGGMGEVYRARDTRLDRFVAVKVIAADLSASSEQRQRFEHEARTISQLSHPHICALYDVGEQDGRAFLVMELLDGETLSERLARGPLPIEQALGCGVAIADALAKAHRQGIVHRDLKPGNVMLTKSGVKLLDFGIAKAFQPSESARHTMIETVPLSPRLTDAGMFVGTLPYVPPEQLTGAAADARSDIFALGAVLFEMTTGRKAFMGTGRVALASAILQHEPPAPSSINSAIPPGLDALIRGCLAKDPDDRWQTAHDVRLQLAALAAPSSVTAAVPARRRRALPASLPWLAAAVAVALAAAAWLRPAPSVSTAAIPSVRFAISPPVGGAFSDTVETLCIALAPDGSQLAYVASDASGEPRVWLRPLAGVEARAVQGTNGARTVIWSPDGRSIAFFAGDKLKRIDLPDGAPVTLSDVPNVRVVGTWGSDQILFSAVPSGIYRVPVSGGPAVLERAPDRARKELVVTWPWFLPDGLHFLYLARTGAEGSVMVAAIGQPGRVVVAAVSNAQYVDPGFLVYARESTLLAQPFDPKTGQTTGDPFAVAEPLRYFLSTGAATFATSRNGVLVYQGHLEQGRLAWFDRSGKQIGVVSEAASHSRVRISRDGARILFDRAQPLLGSFDLWLYDVKRGIEQRVTSDRLSETSPVWLHGDGAAMFSGSAPPHLFHIDLSTGAQREMMPGGFQLAEDVSPDGKTFVFTQRTTRGNFDIWTASLEGGFAPSALRETPYDETSVRFSPDGRYLSYASDESGRYEVYLTTFPVTGPATRLSMAGGNLPRWSRDGREMFYLAADLHIVSLPIQTTPSLSLGKPTPLFPVPSALKWDDAKPSNGWNDYDVSPDGKFLVVVPEPANQQPLTAVLDWRPLIRKGR